jgi:hypothetical protein
MFEADLDEEIKKKKRRVLVVLLVLMLGTAGALPFIGVTGAPSAAAPKSTPEPSTHTVAPTKMPQPPTREPTETAAPTATPRPTATSTPIPVPPTATEKLPDGAGGGEPEASSTPTGAPTDAPTSAPTDTLVPPTPTPEAPGELPTTGADAGRSGRLALGLAVFSVGALMLAVGLALHEEALPASMPQTAPPTAVAQTVQERPGQPAGASPGSGTQVWLTLGLTAVVLILAFIAGYTLRKIRKQ